MWDLSLKTKNYTKYFSKAFKHFQFYVNTLFIKLQRIIFKHEMDFILLDYEFRTGIRSPILYKFSKDIIEHLIRNPDKTINLKQGLDQESIKLIDQLLNSMYYYYTHNIIKRSKLKNVNVIQKIKEERKFLNNYKKNSKIFGIALDVSIYFYKHGLIFVPNETVDKLKNRDFIDGGAYNGDSALMFERDFKPNKIYSFEPSKSAFESLLTNIKSNNLKEVIPINEGLGEKETTINFFSCGPSSTFYNNGNEITRVTTIDRFVEENKLDIGLIKFDIEGYALNALKGAIKTLKKFKPILLISIYHNAQEFFYIKDFINQLDQGYIIIIRKLGAHKIFTDTTLIAW